MNEERHKIGEIRISTSVYDVNYDELRELFNVSTPFGIFINNTMEQDEQDVWIYKVDLVIDSLNYSEIEEKLLSLIGFMENNRNMIDRALKTRTMSISLIPNHAQTGFHLSTRTLRKLAELRLGIVVNYNICCDD